MAVEKTALDIWKPDGVTELVKRGAEVISHNGQRMQDLFAADQAAIASLTSRLGRAEANINAGTGGGPGIVEDPDNPGTYFIADSSPLFEDPGAPGFYTFYEPLNDCREHQGKGARERG